MLYLVRALGTDLYKIGVARDVHKRMHGLRTACPLELEIVHTVEGTHVHERHLHAALDKWRVRGEWFQLDAEWREIAISAMNIIETGPKPKRDTPPKFVRQMMQRAKPRRKRHKTKAPISWPPMKSTRDPLLF